MVGKEIKCILRGSLGYTALLFPCKGTKDKLSIEIYQDIVNGITDIEMKKLRAIAIKVSETLKIERKYEEIKIRRK